MELLMILGGGLLLILILPPTLRPDFGFGIWLLGSGLGALVTSLALVYQLEWLTLIAAGIVFVVGSILHGGKPDDDRVEILSFHYRDTRGNLVLIHLNDWYEDETEYHGIVIDGTGRTKGGRWGNTRSFRKDRIDSWLYDDGASPERQVTGFAAFARRTGS